MLRPSRNEHGTGAPAGAVGAFLLLVALTVFWPSLDNGFVCWDDNDYVVANAIVRKGPTLQGQTDLTQ